MEYINDDPKRDIWISCKNLGSFGSTGGGLMLPCKWILKIIKIWYNILAIKIMVITQP